MRRFVPHPIWNSILITKLQLRTHNTMAYVDSLDSRTSSNKHSDLIDRPRAELTEAELQQLEDFEFNHGPMSLLQTSMNNGTPVVIYCRNNHKLIAKVKAFDRHCNLVLEDVKEMWTETTKNSKGKVIKSASKERFVAKMFLRGDSVIIVLKV